MVELGASESRAADGGRARARAVWRGLGGIACAPAGRRGAALVGGQRDQAHARVRRTRWHAVSWGLWRFFQGSAAARGSRLGACGRHAGGHPAPPGQTESHASTPAPPSADGPSAQGVKRRTGGRVVAGTTTSICGAGAAVHARGAASTVRQTIHTRVVARHPLPGRPCHGRLARTGRSCAKALPWGEQPLGLRVASDHFGLAHDRLRQRFSAPQPSRGAGSPQRWPPLPAAMAAGRTDHVWTREAWLSSRVPPDLRDPLDQQATSVTSSLFHTRYRGTAPKFACIRPSHPWSSLSQWS